ncbi:hypothetical protein ACFL27_27980 [candidate division CSSED10-310 bacterium]|uniref:Uncharacterized protein n=1 Tax=candidate division CSSED10-310 bacterium TaxID=2855610 RepID=A0ABV6Z6I6_UNCC1
MIAMYCVCRHCSASTSLTRVPTFFSLSLSGLTAARDRGAKMIDEDQVTKRLIERIQERLRELSAKK